MEMWTSLLIVLAVFALGDVISILTKARISSLFVIMMTFLILFLTHTIDPFPDPYDSSGYRQTGRSGDLGPHCHWHAPC